MTTDLIDIDNKLKADNKKYLIRIASLIIVNTTLFAFTIKGQSIQDNFLTSLNANLFGFNILGFILGTIFAAFPYRQLTYGKKYLRASILCILTLQFIMTGGLILIFIMHIFGWY